MATPREAPTTLLLLRVFGYEARTQKLLDTLAARWRHGGPICLVAGTDSAYVGLEPHDFYNFISGRFSRQFIGGAEDFDRQLCSDMGVPDPDGLHRVEDFYSNTRQMTVSRPVKKSDAILMDVRGFTEANQGCIFELQELVRAAPFGANPVAHRRRHRPAASREYVARRLREPTAGFA